MEPVAAQLFRPGGARLHRLGPCLEDVDPAVDAIASPLDVHRAAVVLLDDERGARKLLGLGIGDRKANPVGRRHVHGGDRSAGGLDHSAKIILSALSPTVLRRIAGLPSLTLRL